MSLLRRIGAGEDAKSIRARIPADLADALDAFDRDAKRQGFEFPRDDIVADALRKALAKARAELDKLAGDNARFEGGSVARRQANPPKKDGAEDGGEDGSKTDGQDQEATKSEAAGTGGRVSVRGSGGNSVDAGGVSGVAIEVYGLGGVCRLQP